MEEFAQLRKKILNDKFSKLNDMQKQAVYKVNGPVLILAGAGSGKTTVLVNRIAYMVKYGDAYNSENPSTLIGSEEITLLKRLASGDKISDEENKYCDDVIAENPIKPYNILTITFTNKAANELKERLEKMLGEIGKDVNAGTFHWACVRILRREIEKLGYSKNFTIYDTDDSKRVIKECLKELRMEEKRFPVKQMLTEISRLKDKLITPKEYMAVIEGDFYKTCLYNLYDLYQKKLKSANAVDFDDIIFLTVKLFENDKQTLEYYRNKYKYIMVDEYQDTNIAQYKLISLLSDEHKNICVVGDDDQSIYRFRGATIENILNFENEFENAKVIRLEQNYRSTQNILDAANAIIKNNTERKGKNLWTSKGNGEKVVQFRCDDERKEAEFVTDVILDGISKGDKYSDFAILYRTNSQSNNFEQNFVKNAIPYRIIGGNRFFDRMEIKDIVSYLCVINNPDDELRLQRIINQPKRAIGEASVSVAKEISQSIGQSLFETICTADQFAPLKRASSAMCKFGEMIKELSEFANTQCDLGQLVCKVIEKSGYDRYLKELGDEGITRADNVQELVNTMARYSEENPDATLSDYLEEVSLMTDIDNYDSDADTVVMMTVHSAKGLEFNKVLLVGMEEGVFPGAMSICEPSELQEERRLAYVGVTRAKEKLYLTGCARRMMYGRTQNNTVSRFLREIPDDLKEIIDKCSRNIFSFENDYENSNDFYRTSGASYISGKNNFDMFTANVKAEEKSKLKLDFNIGDTVVHRAFGEGMVLSMTPMANDTLVEVAFDKVGTKKIMANFAKLNKK